MSISNSPHIYQIRLVSPDKSLNKILQVRGDEVIIDIVEQQGIDFPVSCRAGACVSCTAKLIEGTVEHLHCFLKRQEEEAGFILPCMAYPLSDCTILTHQEDALLDLSERI